jgi:exodeoxyribonuclease V alpha subunit
MIFGNKIELLHEMAEKKLVSSLAINIAEFLCGLEKNLSGEEKTTLAAVSALLYEWISSGSICLTKDDIKTFIETNGEALSGIGFPNWEKIGSILSKSSCCTSDPEKEQRPVVLEGERIYFYKYWLYETSLAEKVLKLSRLPGKYLERALPIKNAFIKLFKDPQSIEQKNAADKVIENRFSVITGGPGTGKTTTVAKIIAGILSVFPEERIVLAAPTGKAAARMTEALREAIKRMEGQGLAEAPEIFEKMNSLEGKTIHKLLNWMFGRPEKNREDPIYADLIIIDEASMVDITMFSSLLDAISDNTSLVLLGDKDQLASVDAGNVLCDICNAAEAGLFERQIEAKLTKSHRFEEHPSIGRLADAVNGQKDAKEIIRICTEEPDLDFMSKTTAEIVGKAAENYGFLSDKTLKPAEILDKLNNFKILCPSKEDSFGVAKLNEAIERALGRNGSDDFYNGRPIMITKNDYSNNLMNGDCGVILGNRAYFKTDSGVKSFPVSVLPPLETVYAMTIHKSQGSEYDSVLVVMPENNMPMLTKELLYTAITRAKERVAITAQESVLEYTLKRSAARNSGFVNALKKLKKSDEK